MRIRPAVTSDAETLADLFVEMEQHYGGDGNHPRSEVCSRIERWIEEQPDAVFLLAEDETGAVIGHLSATPIFPSGGAGQRSLFVKDIYVRDNARGQGIGEELLRSCAGEARKRGMPRLELTVDRANSGAEKLYARLGALDTEKTYMRWEGDSLSNLAGNSQQ